MSSKLISKKNNIHSHGNNDNGQFKQELLNVFQKFGYVQNGKDYEVKVKFTSGNIAWININSIEIIK